jgi:drug/metabolite transporter (DMT)-like permease
MTPVFGFVFAHLLLRDERMTVLKGCALALGVAGVAIIFKDQLAAGAQRAVAGSSAVVASAACVAVSYVVMRRRAKHINPSIITAGQMLSAVVPLLLFAIIVEGNPFEARWTREAVLSGLYLAFFGSILGAWLNYWLLQRIGATKLLSMGLVEPLVAVLLGAAFLEERMSTVTAAGGVCILVAVGVVLDLFKAKP